MPLRRHNGIIVRPGALPLVDAGTGEIVSIILAYECLVFIIAVDDERRQVID